MLIIFCLSCENAEPVPAVQSIDFGYGGGIINAWTVYSLDASGKLTGEHHISMPFRDTVMLFLTKTIDPIDAKRLMSRAGLIFPYNYNEDGNPGSFLRFRASNSDHYIGWQDPTRIDSRALQLYKDLNKLLK